jgi:hypothetical protein
MGFFDRFSSKPAPDSAPKPAGPAGPPPQIAAARARLEAKDVPGAMALYEEILAAGGDGAAELEALSADLGSYGAVRELIELVAPRYDPERHGPNPGLNLLQAYFAVRDTDSAAHLLDVLRGFRGPGLQEKLGGFDRALEEMREANDRDAAHTGAVKVNLVTISKPIWFYGLEEIAPHLLGQKSGQLRRVCFAPLALPGEDEPGADVLLMSRGWPLWLAETFQYSAGWEAVAAFALDAENAYAPLRREWTAEALGQLAGAGGGVDYIVAGAVQEKAGDFELQMRIWEVKGFRELKKFSTRWTPVTANDALRDFYALLRTYLEWTALPAGNGFVYQPPAQPCAYLRALDAALGLFLVEKAALARTHMPVVPLDDRPLALGDTLPCLAAAAVLARQKTLGFDADPAVRERTLNWVRGDSAVLLGVGALADRI